ncbi:GNAT family N-acetyltransferase [Candidatus Thorarchaeota archaeon]|nr:MAG: GNAT family N-acetyltransferase [Candidatus Thorarchaeota archaeon]
MTLNRARNDPLWKRIEVELAPILGEGIVVFFPQTWTQHYLTWYKEIERDSFRPALTYSQEEIEERIQKEEVLMMFVLKDESPEGLVLGYRLEDTTEDIFYLDTIAVRQKGRGIGTILLKVLFTWAKKMGYRIIQLDTEEENETGIRLSYFYQQLGFRIAHSDEETGNVTMQLEL